MKTIRDYLIDILDYTNKIKNFTQEGKDNFFVDEKTQLAVIRAFEVIGEIAKRVPDDLLSQQPQAEWKQIKGFRDFLAHNYDAVVLHIVWGAVEKLSVLETAVNALLPLISDTENDE
jgi:uncharacterized protein with HEPN domain